MREENVYASDPEDCADEMIQQSQKLYEEILEKKRGNPSAFVSHWEADENAIAEWTADELRQDVCKRFVKSAELGELCNLEEMYKEMKKTNDDVEKLFKFADNDGYTALHRSSYNGHKKCVEWLLLNGADVNHLTNDHWTPLHSAVMWNQYECACILLRYGANQAIGTLSGQTPLHLAASQSSNSSDILTLLLYQVNCPVDKKNKQNQTPYDIAKSSNVYASLFEPLLLYRTKNEDSIKFIEK
ncbi:hypothetical protein SNEBB_011493 [Seison nebaliae]|nr:hypothetical protein SNEBB_011493 [Seison nebaliae]